MVDSNHILILFTQKYILYFIHSFVNKYFFYLSSFTLFFYLLWLFYFLKIHCKYLENIINLSQLIQAIPIKYISCHILMTHQILCSRIFMIFLNKIIHVFL
jgi:hypothetical protein